MALIFNGTEIPQIEKHVTFNGTFITDIYHNGELIYHVPAKIPVKKRVFHYVGKLNKALELHVKVVHNAPVNITVSGDNTTNVTTLQNMGYNITKGFETRKGSLQGTMNYTPLYGGDYNNIKITKVSANTIGTKWTLNILQEATPENDYVLGVQILGNGGNLLYDAEFEIIIDGFDYE